MLNEDNCVNNQFNAAPKNNMINVIDNAIGMYKSSLRSKQVILDQQLSIQEWSQLLEYIKSQDIFTLTFPAVSKNLKYHNSPELLALETLLRKYWLSMVFNNRRIFEKSKEIFDRFSQAGIDVILLKGFNCSILYSNPEHRTIVDLDLYVHRDDTKKAIQLLNDLGFTQKSDADCEYEISLISNDRIVVELHHHLSLYKHFENSSRFAKAIWNTRQSLDYKGYCYPIMSHECQVVHLIMHMAKHLVWSGINLRLLSDLTLYTEKYFNRLNWELTKEYIKEQNLYEFALYVFELCVELLDLPSNPLEGAIDRNVLDNLRITLLEKKDHAFFDNVYSRYLNEDEVTDKKILNILKIMFPKPERLPARYNYAKRFAILTPIAWVHRWVVELTVHKDRVIGLWKSETDLHNVKRQRDLMKFFGIEK